MRSPIFLLAAFLLILGVALVSWECEAEPSYTEIDQSDLATIRGTACWFYYVYQCRTSPPPCEGSNNCNAATLKCEAPSGIVPIDEDGEVLKCKEDVLPGPGAYNHTQNDPIFCTADQTCVELCVLILGTRRCVKDKDTEAELVSECVLSEFSCYPGGGH